MGISADMDRRRSDRCIQSHNGSLSNSVGIRGSLPFNDILFSCFLTSFLSVVFVKVMADGFYLSASFSLACHLVFVPRVFVKCINTTIMTILLCINPRFKVLLK